MPRAGRLRRRPNAVIADKAYSSRAIRQVLRGRGIRAVIPEQVDQNSPAEEFPILAVNLAVPLGIALTARTQALTSDRRRPPNLP
ncbi:hypothetical protein [Streptomyces sp. NPDC052127]|uniref:hypothetical protein n=1 Tax=Streptomyces sp. NPDC052127 TaxID=3155679 RepID=UPI003424DF01